MPDINKGGYEMQTIQKITSDVYYIGACDMRHRLFENIYPVPEGMTYNAYLIADDKTVLTDTCDVSVRDRFLENLKAALNGRPLDYVFVHHMEPDHCAVLDDVLTLFPAARIVCNAKTQILIGQFFNRDVSDRVLIVKEGDTLATGRHAFTFYMAPMVHWPEVMVSYDAADKILFSADAFGELPANSNRLYIFEPDANTIYNALLPLYVISMMQEVFLQNAASEQAARVMAMQSANDNAQKLLESLKLEYNKLRQQGITTELLDILGGQVEK